MKDHAKFVGAVLFFFLLTTAGLWWGLFQWIECKEMGHSTLYCIGHVLR